jgi:hypothetical protein
MMMLKRRPLGDVGSDPGPMTQVGRGGTRFIASGMRRADDGLRSS